MTPGESQSEGEQTINNILLPVKDPRSSLDPM